MYIICGKIFQTHLGHCFTKLQWDFHRYQTSHSSFPLLQTKSGKVAISFKVSFQPISRLEVEWFLIYIYMWIRRKTKSIQFPCRKLTLKILKLLSLHIFPLLLPPDTSADTQSHPGITTPEMTEKWPFTSVFGNYHDYHDSLGKPHGTCPIHLGSGSFMQKKGEGTTLAAKPPNWLNWRESLTTMGILWIRQVRRSIAVPGTIAILQIHHPTSSVLRC